jgi:hypothetical protein
MSGLVDALVALAVVALIVVRQVRPQRLTANRRLWALPLVLGYLAVRDGGPAGLVDSGHRTASVLLLAGEIVIGLLMGAAWAWSSRIWTESDGSVWTRGTKATVGVWIGGIALRLGLAGAGALAGVHQGTGALLFALALSLLARSGLLLWRARTVAPATAPAAGAGLR